MNAPQALVLDAMGTLIGLRRSVGQIYAETAADHGLELAPEALDAAFAEAYASAPPLAFPQVERAHLEQAERAWWQQRIETCFKAVGVQPLPIGLSSELFDRFAGPELWGVYPEVPAALERWRQRGLKLVVVSNFDRRLLRLLELLELHHHFEAVLVSSEIGAAKPDPAPLLAALELLQLPADQVWLVGDSSADVRAAAAADMHCLRLNRPSGILLG